MFIILLLLLCVNADEEHIEFEPFPDYYAMLNVSHEASMKEIKSSFRKLAMKFHPDKNKTEGAEVVFQELSEAYSILGDVEKKAEYDQLFKHFYDLEHEDSYQKPPSSADEKPAEPQPWPKESSQQTKERSQDSTKKPDDKKESAKEKPETSNKGESEDLPDDFKNLKGDHEELDDETLFKVLKFLAENDYIITKRTRRVPAQPTSEQFNQRAQHESRSRRSTESGDSHRTYTEYKTTSSGHGEHKAHGHSGHNHTGGHKGHDHAWTNAHQHKPRAEHQNSSYSQQFHGSEQVYCRSSTRWEGNVKITSKTCY